LKKVGLLGGSFNPAHAGHRHISLAALRRLGLDEIWWLVSPQNPLKPITGMASLAIRMASARAAARHPRIKVTAIEAQLGTRYAVDTVTALQRRFAKTRFIWLAGADILPELHRWRRWRALLHRLPIAVLARPRYMGMAMRSPAMAWARRWRHPAGTAADWPDWGLPAIVVLATPANPLSATAIRSGDPRWADRYQTVRSDVF
jgi:nicotinate-nucleotide adenylyltransferase